MKKALVAIIISLSMIFFHIIIGTIYSFIAITIVSIEFLSDRFLIIPIIYFLLSVGGYYILKKSEHKNVVISGYVLGAVVASIWILTIVVLFTASFYR